MNPRQNIKMAMLLVAVVFAASCNSIDYRKADTITKNGGASIQGLQVKGDRESLVFSVVYIDDKQVKRPGYAKVYEIAIGEHSVGIFGERVTSRWNSQYKKIVTSSGGQAEVKFTAKGRHKYEIRGTIIQDTATFHIFDLTDNREASETITVNTRTTKQWIPWR